MRIRFAVLTALAAGVVPALGCGDHSPPPGPPLGKAYPVSGTVTFADGSPLRGGMIHFTPVEQYAGSKIRYEATAMINDKGRYKAGLNDESGAVPGEYKVSVMPRDYAELKNSNSGRIPAQYRKADSTPLTVTIEENDNVINVQLK